MGSLYFLASKYKSNCYLVLKCKTYNVKIFKNMKLLQLAGLTFLIGSQVSANEEYGCWKGYCWARCENGFACYSGQGCPWCYTTKGYSQDFNYVSCNYDGDCDRDWRCAGSCTH